MYPDYGNNIFWDENGYCLGGFDFIDIDRNRVIDICSIEQLSDWYLDWDRESMYHTMHWTQQQWTAWWETGLSLARQVQALLPDGISLTYFCPEDKEWTQDKHTHFEKHSFIPVV